MPRLNRSVKWIEELGLEVPVPGIEHSWMSPQQVSQAFHDERYGIVEASTKSGKTVTHVVWLLTEALQIPEPEDTKVWWCAPNYDQASIGFDTARETIDEFVVSERNSIPKELVLVNGVRMQFRTVDSDNRLYGHEVWATVMDEASRIDEGRRDGLGAKVFAAIDSTMMVPRRHGFGKLRVIGNVRGRNNWMYRQARAAEAGAKHWFYGTRNVDDSIRDGIIAEEEIEVRRQVAEADGPIAVALFKQDFYNIPIDAMVNPFGEKLDQAEDASEEWLGGESEVFDVTTDENPAVAFGLDIARIQDYTVCIGLDRDMRVVKAMRTQRDWGEQKSLLKDFCGSRPVLIDGTGVGDVMEPELRSRGVNVVPYTFSYRSRIALVERIRWALTDRPIKIPAGRIMQELRALERTETEGGRTDYQVPAWEHDDCVFALGLAVEQWHQLFDKPKGIVTLAALRRHKERVEAKAASEGIEYVVA